MSIVSVSAAQDLIAIHIIISKELHNYTLVPCITQEVNYNKQLLWARLFELAVRLVTVRETQVYEVHL